MKKNKVFMIMPFKDEYFEVFELLSDEYGNEFDFSHAGTTENQRDIFSDVMEGIYKSDVIIADLTEKNANVYYELGIAHTLGKKVIVITRNIDELPFDIKNYRAQEYSMDYVRFSKLITSLTDLLNGAVNGKIVFSNPVVNFMQRENMDGDKAYIEMIGSKETDMIGNEDSTEEKGYIEFMEDIQTHTENLTKNIDNMNIDLSNMTDSMNVENEKIQQAQENGNNDTKFIKKMIKKIAEYISTFSNKMECYNQNYKEEWNEIEKNIFGLMENKFIYTEENKKELITYLKTLYEMKKAIIDSNVGVKAMVNSFNQSKGIERTLNQAIALLEIRMNDYLLTMDQIAASIDRMIERGMLIVGNIEFDKGEN